MLNKSITALVLAALIAPTATAQQPTPSAPSNLERERTELDAVGLTPPTILSEGHTLAAGEIMALDFFGRSIYASEDQDAEIIGTIEDLVISPSGSIASVILDVGSYLGDPGRSIAVDFQILVPTEMPDGETRWVLETTPEALSAAPPFQRPQENAN
ncbi:hypothetical protein VE25_06600 [Devosia geojensis]|uniref:PRC-barrel domain-containing protein n=1 Tax=Devosia geojensis TaxID=443610 RepID=A0A0F5FUU6_9HYPH|nr:PRC-barrel domain-containing protein [Devosia geojensis]KKB12588.1 hypothetical protein VE25_06600 [Devosia geojensis]